VPFNSSRERLQRETAAFAASIPAGAIVLDAGAGKSPYKPLFAHTHYESADFGQLETEYATHTYTCDLTRIPVSDGRFDAVILTQVLEHVPDPLAVLNELHRVLKPGSRLLFSSPLFFEEHNQPYDFYRYTRFGVRHLFETSGFDVERVDWLEGYFGTLGYQLATAASSLPRHRHGYGGGAIGAIAAAGAVVFRVVCRQLSGVFHHLEMRHKLTTAGYPKNFVAIARRR
jgi:SAM-dependent methyltransferase